MIHPPIPSSTNPLQAFAEPACVYLLVSAANPTTCKLGFTSHLAARLDSLRQSNGKFDLDRSVVVTAKSRRAALALETVLKTAFIAPHWRAGSKSPEIKPANFRHHNGSSEWYDMRAFQPMVAFVGEMIARDKACGLDRFHLVSGGGRLAAWYEGLRQGQGRGRKSQHSSEAEAMNRLTRSEANFAWVQAWIEARRERLIEVHTTISADGRTTKRTFVFRASSEDDFSGRYDLDQERDELASHCWVFYRRGTVRGAISYFDREQWWEETSHYVVEFAMTPRFDELAGHNPLFADLVSRLRAWLAGPSDGCVEG